MTKTLKLTVLALLTLGTMSLAAMAETEKHKSHAGVTGDLKAEDDGATHSAHYRLKLRGALAFSDRTGTEAATDSGDDGSDATATDSADDRAEGPEDGTESEDSGMDD